jgi:endonuclease YncB( thermonuclease family)
MENMVSLIKIGILLGLLLNPGCERFQSQYDVLQVTDCATLLVHYKGTNRKTRLWGIDCPQDTHPMKDSATLFTRRLALRQKVRLIEYGQKPDGAIIAEVVLLTGENINHLLLQNGLARYAPAFPNNPDPLYVQYEQEARKQKIGAWKTKKSSFYPLKYRNKK